ncbi:Ltp family lipoprotein [Serratia marcescens]|uniref:Ltp family lipoprotein n=1 Tax=Serratia marcescens TaxID=615 RepID=UPI001F096FAD
MKGAVWNYGDISMNFLKIVLTAAVFVAAPTWAGDLTGPQKNAARSAKQYLSVAGFSRDGLIQQLSSDAGDGYEISDATVAVDSLNIDWNQEAVKSAKQYLSMMGFSCKGLIHQLSSSAGDKYTVDQATYGAKQAGGC